MTGVAAAGIVRGVGGFYGMLIFVYVLMSWLPMRGILYDIQQVLGTLVEPYLSIFRRFIPPMGGFDFSPIIAYVVLQLVVSYLLVPLALSM